MSNSIDKLKTFLREMFQFNSNDLDFGIYRIYNLKRNEIEHFIEAKDEECLEPLINKTLEQVKNLERSADLASLHNYLSKLNQQDLLKNVEENFEQLKLFVQANKNEAEKASLLNTLDSSTKEYIITDEIKDKIYNHILAYFEMYYSNGDFGYNNRSRNLYKVAYDADYDGADTLFHWKHRGSLYIKTGASFNAVKFNLKHLDKEFELRLETNEESRQDGTPRNNTKDAELKLYKLHRFEESSGVTRLIFNLSDQSTPKTDLFKTIFRDILKYRGKIDAYLYSEGKPVFKELTSTFDKVQDGGLKGIRDLRVGRKALLTKINKNFYRKNKIELAYENGKEVFSDKILETIYNIDQKLNSFYIGNDSDYFIHENLKEFLSGEKERYIKNYVLSDLRSLLDGKIDNTTLIIAKAFEIVTERLIEFLSAIEDFEKKLFTLKKKVVESEYCLTIENIHEKHFKEILKSKTQIIEWENLFGVKVKTIADLKANPKLVIDTKFFKQLDGSNPFKDTILSEIENLDQKTDGLLVSSENYQGLKLLEEVYKDKVQCIYIDPPYNTGSDDFLYKDNFKHSSWLSMIENRVSLSKKLLSPSGAFFAQIDYKEANNLRSCLNGIFDDSNFIQLISIKTASPAGFKTVNPGPIDVTEYLMFLTKDRTKYNFKKGFVPVAYDPNYNLFIENIGDKAKNWKIASIIDVFYKANNIKNNSDAKKKWGDNWKGIRDVLIGEFALENREFVVSKRDPHKPTDKLKEQLRKSGTVDHVIEIERDDDKSMFVYKGGVLSFYANKVKKIDGKLTPTELLSDFWHDISWAGIASEGNIKLKNGKKPERLIKRLLEISTERNDLVLDFFAGSGTTCAVAQKMKRKWIGIEVGKYFESILKQRLINVLNGEQTGISQDQKWEGGGIFKYIVLEQYEDVLDSIDRFKGVTPKDLQLKYLYKPELNKINSTLDLSKPFDNTVKYGHPSKEGYVDLVDTYNYLQGYTPKSIRTYNTTNKYYKVVETNYALVIWRDIKLGEDDSDEIVKIVSKYPNVTQVEVNFEFNILAAEKNMQIQVDHRWVTINVINGDAFNRY